MMTNETIQNWLNVVDEQGEKLGWTDYKAYRNYRINRLSDDDDIRDILEYLESHE